jgi:hypothetical protein
MKARGSTSDPVIAGLKMVEQSLSRRKEYQWRFVWKPVRGTRESEKVKELFKKKKHIYCKYTETKLISLFNVIPFNFKAPVPTFQKFFNSVRKKKRKTLFGCVFIYIKVRIYSSTQS